MAFEFTEYLLAEGVGDLGVDSGVLDVLVAEVVGDVLDAAASFQKMNGNGVAKGVDGSALDAGGFGIAASAVGSSGGRTLERVAHGRKGSLGPV